LRQRAKDELAGVEIPVSESPGVLKGGRPRVMRILRRERFSCLLALPVAGRLALRRSTRIPILTGEKLEMLRESRPFLDSEVVDIICADLAFAGGITGTHQIAGYAQIS